MGDMAEHRAIFDEAVEDAFEPRQIHAHTFPRLHPNIYERDVGDATSDTSLLSRSSTPEIRLSHSDEPEDHEMIALMPDSHEHASRFSEQLEPQSSTPSYDSPPAQSYVLWGVSWRQPIIMIIFALLGITTATSHHFYYHELNDTVAGNTSKQQWVIWIGTGFNSFTLFLLNSAITIALTQSIWFTVKRHALTVGGLDNLFGLFTDMTGFFKWDLLKKAKLAILIAFVFWGMPLTAIIPPGTISVVSGDLRPSYNMIAVPTFNWTCSGAEVGGILQGEVFPPPVSQTIAYPAPQTLQIASQVAENMEVGPPITIVPNSSYYQQFFGPALQCTQANASQQVAFNYYNEANYNQTRVITVPQFQSGDLPYGYDYLQFFSAFSPQLSSYIDDVLPVAGEPDHYNNWAAILPENATDFGDTTNGAEFWIQLADSSLVCALTNASFDIGFESFNNTQNVIQRNITHLNRWTWDNTSTDYLGVMASIGPLLYGNVTMLPYPCDVPNDGKGECYVLSGSSSQVLQTGLTACEEFTNSWWNENIELLNKTHMDPAITTFDGQLPYMCRNGSFAQALEDLAANVTIGLLGLNIDQFKPITEHVNATILSTPNMYAYDSAKLLISYGAGIIATVFVVIIGLITFSINGISHDTSFSSIMTTTRNPDLDKLSVGQSLSAIGEELESTRLIFGGNRVSWEKGGRESVERAAFGLEGKVGMLRKGGKYI